MTLYGGKEDGELLAKYGLDPKMIRILKNLYEGIMASGRIEG